MKEYIACDSHRDYSVFAQVNENGHIQGPVRVGHDRQEFRKYLRTLPAGSPVALEATGGWYWLVDELEGAGLEPVLVHALEAKKLMRAGHKTDGRDAVRLAVLLRNGTLPGVWIPSAKLRDLRSLMRTRLALVAARTRSKNRIVATVHRYGLQDETRGDLFRGKGRVKLNVYLGLLPEQTREASIIEWTLVDELSAHIADLEERIKTRIGRLGWVRLLKTIPGVGEILGATLWLEIGAVDRFPSAAHLASYAGLVPVVHSSGGKTSLGPTSKASNHYLRWAFVEAACVVAALHSKMGDIHAVRLYQRLRESKGHAKASVALARHLAESAWWILSKQQPYREPVPIAVSSSTHGSARN